MNRGINLRLACSIGSAEKHILLMGALEIEFFSLPKEYWVLFQLEEVRVLKLVILVSLDVNFFSIFVGTYFLVHGLHTFLAQEGRLIIKLLMSSALCVS